MKILFQSALVIILITIVVSIVKTERDKIPTTIEMKELVTVETPEITLQPGQSTVIKTFNEQTGRRYTYTAKWIKFSERSWMQTSNHGFRGMDGDDKIVGCRVYPAKGTSFASSGRSKNEKVYYIHIRNDGPDAVTFVVKLHDEIRYNKPI
jgi:hypothetical protein